MQVGARVVEQQCSARKPRSSVNIVLEPVHQTEDRRVRNFELFTRRPHQIFADGAQGPSGQR